MMHYRKLPVGYSERYHTVVSTYENNTVFQLHFNTKQRLERAVTDVRREMKYVVLYNFAADSV